jgi:hypothetical protein
VPASACFVRPVKCKFLARVAVVIPAPWAMSALPGTLPLLGYLLLLAFLIRVAAQRFRRDYPGALCAYLLGDSSPTPGSP